MLPRRLPDPRVSWTFVVGGFAALATVVLLWVGVSVVRSVTEPARLQAERDATVAPAALVAPRPTLTLVPPLLPRIGQRVESAGIQLAVSAVVKRSIQAGSVLAPGRTFLVADVVLESRRQPATPYGPSGFRVRAADGVEYVGLIPSADDQRSLKGGVLAMGGVAQGTVAFDVPAGADGFVLAFQPDDLVAGYQTIRIALGN